MRTEYYLDSVLAAGFKEHLYVSPLLNPLPAKRNPSAIIRHNEVYYTNDLEQY